MPFIERLDSLSDGVTNVFRLGAKEAYHLQIRMIFRPYQVQGRDIIVYSNYYPSQMGRYRMNLRYVTHMPFVVITLAH